LRQGKVAVRCPETIAAHSRPGAAHRWLPQGPRTPVAVVRPSVALGLLAKIQGLTLRYRVGEVSAW
jgi:hypothetical protein